MFDCSTDELGWTLIIEAQTGNLNDAHPFCERNEPTRVGAVRLTGTGWSTNSTAVRASLGS